MCILLPFLAMLDTFVGTSGVSASRLVCMLPLNCLIVFFFQAEDGIRDYKVTGVQTCALPIWFLSSWSARENSLNSITPEASLKVEVSIHEQLSFSGRVCFGCHGLEVDRAHIDYTDRKSVV